MLYSDLYSSLYFGLVLFWLMQEVPFAINTKALIFIESNLASLVESGLLMPPFLANLIPSLVRKELKKMLSTGEYKALFSFSTLWHACYWEANSACPVWAIHHTTSFGLRGLHMSSFRTSWTLIYVNSCLRDCAHGFGYVCWIPCQ